MPSLRKRVSSYFRQLSFHNEPREKRNNFIENTFINKYLQGEVKLKEGPPIIYGKNPTDLPNYDVGTYSTGSNSIVGCYTGPNGGLTTVKRSEKHLSVLDQDIDFIDTAEESVAEPTPIAPAKKSPARQAEQPLDNTTMVIKVAGQEYHVTNRKARRNKSQSLGSLSDFKIEIDKTKRIANSASSDNNNGDAAKCDRLCDSNRNEEPVVVVEVKRRVRIEASGGEKGGFTPLEKSQSEGNPFGHKKRGKITRLAQRPTVDATSDAGGGASSTATPNLPQEWSRRTEHCFGVSDSLYDKNLITKMKNGDPIADCFGIIARTDSAILAVADGVNWGEKASIAAKSAIHGCIHYLNKTIFLDTKPFDNLIRVEEGAIKSETPVHESRISNTREVFVCLLRAFNCAHDLILENKGMLTTLTVAIVLPLKKDGERNAEQSEGDGFVCCVCNVGDTLAYVYSQKYGVRELTKGSHDINCNRDMRDALGALGPVDGINPELSNLTLSITTIQKGDIVLIASDGLTDNFDPNVCKFTVSPDVVKTRKPSTTTQPPKTVKPKEPTAPIASKQVPTKPPRRVQTKPAPPKAAPVRKTTPPLATTSKTSEESGNPLVAAFLRDNPLNKSAGSSQRGGVVAGRPLKSASAKDMSRTLNPKPPERNYSFLRSKTSLDLRSAKSIARNPDGMPFVTPLQRYELTLLLIEDILKRGISGKENQCVTAKKLCENLVSFTISITNAKRRTLEDADLYFNNQNGVMVEVSQQEKKLRRKRGLERVQNLPGKLDHVTAVAYNVANTVLPP